MRVGQRVALIVAGVACVGGCTAGPTTVAAPVQSSTATAAPSPSTPLPSSPAPTPSPALSPGEHAYPTDYDDAILAAWAGHDTKYLQLLTDPKSVTRLYALGRIDQHWTLRDRGGSTSTTTSFYDNRNGDEIALNLTTAAVYRHAWHAGVFNSFDPTVYPSGATAYVTKFMDAWFNGNASRMARLATPATITALTAHRDRLLDPDYKVSAAGSAAGVTYVHVVDQSFFFDVTLTLAVDTLGHPQAIIACRAGCQQ